MHTNGISNVVWLPPEAGDAIACVCVDGTFSIWEEVGEGLKFSHLRFFLFVVLMSLCAVSDDTSISGIIH